MKKSIYLGLLLTSLFAINALSDSAPAPLIGYAPTAPARENALRGILESKCKRAQEGIYNGQTTSIYNLTPTMIENIKAGDRKACTSLGVELQVPVDTSVPQPVVQPVERPAPILGYAPTAPARENALRGILESKCNRAKEGIYNQQTTSIVNLTPTMIESMKASDQDACRRLGK